MLGSFAFLVLIVVASCAAHVHPEDNARVDWICALVLAGAWALFHAALVVSIWWGNRQQRLKARRCMHAAKAQARQAASARLAPGPAEDDREDQRYWVADAHAQGGWRCVAFGG